jgi:hypothetical protein
MRPQHLLLLVLFPLLFSACDKDDGPFTQVKSNERLVYLAIKEYREDNGLTGPFVLQFIMVAEAQIYSLKMAGGSEPLGAQGLADHWETIHQKIGGYNDQALVLKTTASNEDDILSELLNLQGAESVLLEDLTQCGVGIEKDSEGNNYVTVLMMKVD